MNCSECIPFAFSVYATYEVDSRSSDLRLHTIIDKLNPDLHSIDDFNGQKRVLYVLCSRKKQNFNLSSEKGRKTQKGYEYRATDELTCIKCVYD